MENQDTNILVKAPVKIQAKNNMKSVLGKAFVGVCLVAIGFFIGSFQTVIASKLESKASIKTFWRVWTILDSEFVSTTFRNTSVSGEGHASGTPETVVDSNLSTEDRRIYGAIKGMVESEGDPYTTFFPPKEAIAFETEIKGSFGGVGMEVGKKDGVITVIAPLPKSPAEKAGIKTGDKVVSINDKSTVDMSVDTAVSLIRGDIGTTVKLGIYRDGLEKPLDISIVRDTIKLPTLDYKHDAAKGVFTIKVYSFSEEASKLFAEAMLEFRKTNASKLVLDLRGNPGGYLESAVDISSWFIPAGKVIVSQDYGTKKAQEFMRSVGHGTLAPHVKMAVLVDGGSASASEIVAGALQDYGVATIVGQKTFGKGSVQEYMKITENTGLKVTIARWLTPKGNSISVAGLTPDVEVTPTPEDIKNKIDAQFNKAVEILSK